MHVAYKRKNSFLMDTISGGASSVGLRGGGHGGLGRGVATLSAHRLVVLTLWQSGSSAREKGAVGELQVLNFPRKSSKDEGQDAFAPLSTAQK